MTEPPVLVRAERLQTFLVDVLRALGARADQAEATAGLMVRTDLRGVDSHGVGMLPRYHELWQAGFIAPAADPVVVRDDLATALLDGQKGLGHWVSAHAMRMAIDKAATYGIGIVVCRNSTHYGAAANYSMMALERDMIGLSTTNSPYVAMVPTFGRAAMLSTNPISFAAPSGRHAPFVLDMATTTVAVGKLHVAARWEKPIPAGWALDEQGLPTTDPLVALKHRLLTPLGGTRELGSHKGYGLAAMVDILSGVLPGAVFANRFFTTGLREQGAQDVGHCFAAIDPARFRPLDEFKQDMDAFCEALRSTPPAAGHDRVQVAGEPEAASEVERRRHGIPLAPALVAQCNAVARAVGAADLA
jgi:LDH2 family malate/lactate/ureidoglycolate dehydrogenase